MAQMNAEELELAQKCAELSHQINGLKELAEIYDKYRHIPMYLDLHIVLSCGIMGSYETIDASNGNLEERIVEYELRNMKDILEENKNDVNRYIKSINSLDDIIKIKTFIKGGNRA
jgi:hypothetical protein